MAVSRLAGALQIGDTFGAYRIVARLGSGGMARLYLARLQGAAGFARPVALKVIHAHLAHQASFVRMFVDEATLSSKIQDPNVVHVEDLGEVDGTLYLAMEYVHGTSLVRILEAVRSLGRRLSPVIVAYLGAQIASGLHAAHETTDESGRSLGIVHRDVSPHNVLVSYKGHVKVIDFGVAKALSKSQLTREGAILGKLGYMPPEQANSESVDRRADVYALGVVLWEMLTGRRLFCGTNEMVLIEMVKNPTVEPPSVFAPEVPPALEAAVLSLLKPRADDRPNTALEARHLLLDAVPEARSIDPSDVAALLAALLPDQIAREGEMLAAVEREAGKTASRASLSEALPASMDPASALANLTLPSVMIGERSLLRGRSLRRWSVGAGAFGCLAAALAYAVASPVRRAPTDVAPAVASGAVPTPQPAALVEPAATTAPAEDGPATAASPVVSAPPPAPTKPSRSSGAKAKARAAASSSRKGTRTVGGVVLYEE